MKTLLLLSAILLSSSALAQAQIPLELNPSFITAENGCSLGDVALTLKPSLQSSDSEIRIRNLRPDRCLLSSGDMVSIGISAGHVFFTGANVQWSHQNASGKILFHVNAEIATSRFFNDVYANSNKIAADIHIGRSGAFAGPMAQWVFLHNPLISGPEVLKFPGYGLEAGYQKRVGNHFNAEVTVGVSVLGPDYDIGILEGRVGISWLIFKSRGLR